jgi:hypothetical protein
MKKAEKSKGIGHISPKSPAEAPRRGPMGLGVF